jgi:phosphoglycolate phosphatase
MVKLVYPELAIDDATFLAHRQDFLDRDGQQIVVETDLFEGMYPLLHMLEQHQIPWGIVTNKPRNLSESLLEALNLQQRCSVLVCPDDVTHAKPHPEPMFLAAKQLQIDPEQIIYVGDHPRDIEAGRNADMYTILAAYGYLPEQHRDDLQAWQADCIIDTVQQLHHVLQQQLAI